MPGYSVSHITTAAAVGSKYSEGDHMNRDIAIAFLLFDLFLCALIPLWPLAMILILICIISYIIEEVYHA